MERKSISVDRIEVRICHEGEETIVKMTSIDDPTKEIFLDNEEARYIQELMLRLYGINRAGV